MDVSEVRLHNPGWRNRLKKLLGKSIWKTAFGALAPQVKRQAIGVMIEQCQLSEQRELALWGYPCPILVEAELVALLYNIKIEFLKGMEMERKYQTIGCIVLGSILSLAALAEDKKNVASEDKNVVESPAEIFDRAELAVQRQDVKEALKLFKKAADQNYIPAQVYLGEFLDVAEFDDEAVGWFMTAAYQGNPAGAFGLAKMYAEGEGIAQSNEKALFWFKFAAEKNHVGAVKMMAATYKQGLLGQKIDLGQGKHWSDKLPALKEAEIKEQVRKNLIAKKAAEEAKKQARSEKEEAKQKFLEEQASEEVEEKEDGGASGIKSESGAKIPKQEGNGGAGSVK